MFKNKIGRYFIYAIGEILLVVIGILLALNINNTNEAKKETDEYLRILKSVKFDLKKDTINVDRALPYFESRSKLANRILNNELSDQDYKTCLMCTPLLAREVPIALNYKGITLLKTFNVPSSENDSLVGDINTFYQKNKGGIELLKSELSANVIENLKHWRDNYPWFSNIISGKGHPEYIDYIMNDSDFRNRVAYYKIIAGDNYVTTLKNYKKNVKKLVEQIDTRLQQE